MMTMRAVFAAVVVAALMAVAMASSPQCKDMSGNNVDWFAMIKFPHLSSSKNSAAASGYGVMYMDANDESWTVESTTLQSSTSGALAKTLSQAYGASSSSHAWFLFNDDTPSGVKTSSHAHQKGVVFFDDSQGYYLIHSVPRFPEFGSKYGGFPENEITYGQSFLCVTLSYESLATVGAMLEITWPQVYESNLPSSFTGATASNFEGVINGTHSTSPQSESYTVTTVGGQKFTTFAKNAAWDSDLFEDLVAPKLDNGLLAETWMNGVNPLPSYCTPEYKYDVINIRELSIVSGGVNISWTETQDHSKWAITQSRYWACIGDLNRQNGQRIRGGGTWCQDTHSVWSQFSNLITWADSC